MDITAIRNDPNPEGHIFQEILQHTDTKSAIAAFLDREANEASDALSAVKLDPAVLEAQITVNRSVKNEHIPASLTKKIKGLFNGPPDALSAVKLDPAVLEAQITVNRSVKNEHTPASLTKKIKDAESQRRFDFDRAMYMQCAVLMSLSGQQLNLLTQYVNTLRMQRNATQKLRECAFCKNNGYSEMWYTTHFLKDRKGRVRCPVLRAYSCRRCGATGDHAHTIKYCPNQ